MARKARYSRTDIIVMCVAAALLLVMLVLAANSLSGPTGAAVVPIKAGSATTVAARMIGLASNVPVVNSVTTSTYAYFNASLYLIANVTDDNLASVTFTVVAPDSTVVVNNAAGSGSGDIWNSPSFVLSQGGVYNFSVTATDGDPQSSTFSRNITFLNTTLSLSSSIVLRNATVTVSGNVGEWSGAAAAARPVLLFEDGKEILRNGTSLPLVSNSITDMFLYDPSGENITDPSDDFSSAAVDTTKWNVYGGCDASVLRNQVFGKFEMNRTGGGASASCGINTDGKWFFTGDFDVQVDVEKISGTASDGGPQFWVYDSGWVNALCVRRSFTSGNRWDSYTCLSGTCGGNYNYNASSDNTGSMRLKRVGGTLTAYFLDGDTWNQINSYTNAGATGPMWVELHLHSVTPNLVHVDWDNFKVNSGNTSYQVSTPWVNHSLARMSSWYNEPYQPNEDFSGTTLDTSKWNEMVTGGRGTRSYDGQEVKMSLASGSGWANGGGVASENKWVLTGDFDIQIEYSDVVRGTSTDGGLWFAVYTAGSSDAFYMRRRFANNVYDANANINGAWQSGSSVSWTATSGKMRIKRQGNTLTGYYWTGSSWKQLHTYTHTEFATDMYMMAILNGDGVSGTMSGDYDNFVINKGRIAAGPLSTSTRGSKQEFPDKALIVSHDKGVEIIDANTGLMWMRLLLQTSASVFDGPAIDVAADNGNVYGLKVGGANLRGVNFYKDQAFAAGNGNNFVRAGGLARRNLNPGWGTYSAYSLPSDTMNDVAVAKVGNDTYAAVGTAAGVAVVKNELYSRKDMAGNVVAVYFGMDGTLYYANATHLSKESTHYRTADFGPDASASLAGVTDITSDGTYLYVGTTSGVSKRPMADIATQVANYTTADVLTGSNNVTKVLFDGVRLYVATTTGLNQIDPVNNVQLRFWNAASAEYIPASNVAAIGATGTFPLGTDTLAVGTASGGKVFKQGTLTTSSGTYSSAFTAPPTAGLKTISAASWRNGSIIYGMANATLDVRSDMAAIVDSIRLTTTDQTKNDTLQNLTLLLSSSSPLGRNVTNITTWYRNGTSVMLLNMPMEATGRETTNVTDYSGFSRNGTVYGAVWNLTGGRNGRGAYTMRANSNISFGNVLNFERTDRWSFTAWVKRSNTSGLDFFLTKQYHVAPYAGWDIYGTGNFLCMQLINTNPTNQMDACGYGLIGNGWHHVAVTLDGSSQATGMAFYVDGVLQTTSVNSNALTASIQTTAPLLIGDRANGGFGLNGNIDDVAIWNRTLSAHEIALLAADNKNAFANDELVAGDVWTSCVTPNDGTQDGAQACSNNVTVVQSVVAISGVTAGNVTDTTATVAWATDYASNTTVRYGTTTALGSNAGADNSVTQHSVSLSGLTNGALYYYNVTSCASPSLCTTSGPYNFTTMGSYYPNCPNITGYWTVSGAYSLTVNKTCIDVTVPSGASIAFTGRYAITATTITVASGGTMTATGYGCGAGTKANDANSCVASDATVGGGGGNGGAGGNTYHGVGASQYGNALSPQQFGGGGSTHTGAGGAGGGIIMLFANSVNLDGSLTTNGSNGGESCCGSGSHAGGGGAGGSVLIVANEISGAGSISAIGGNGGNGGYISDSGGGGAGGRVAVYYNSSTFSPSSSSVAGGLGGTANWAGDNGEAGTMFLVDVDDNQAWVKSAMDFDSSQVNPLGIFKRSASDAFNFTVLTLLGSSARMRLNASIDASVLNISVTSLTCSPAVAALMAFNTGVRFGGRFLAADTVLHGSSLSLTNCAPLTLDDPSGQLLDIPSLSSSDGITVHAASNALNAIAASTDLVVNGSAVTMNGVLSGKRINVTASTATVGSSGILSTVGGGCGGSTRADASNNCVASDATYSGGGAYGGAGGSTYTGVGGIAYGNALLPVLYGSGGNTNVGAGGAGGGVIVITTPSLTINGVLNASGTNGGTSCCGSGSHGGGGGAGGSVLLVTDSLSGTGAITAIGGNGADGGYISNGGGGGGGGRVAVYYNTSTFSPLSSAVSAGKGATAFWPATDGGSGTMFLLDVDDNVAAVKGAMDFDNSQVNPYGAFKRGAADVFNFSTLTILGTSARIRFNASIDTSTLNISATSLTCSPTVPMLLAINTSIRFGGNFVATDTLPHSSSLALTNCAPLTVDDPAGRLIDIPSMSSSDGMTLHVASGALNAIAASTDLYVNGSAVTFNGLLSAKRINVTAGTATIASSGIFSTVGMGCGGSTRAGASNSCIASDGTDGGGGAYGGAGGPTRSGVGGAPYGNALLPVLYGAGGMTNVGAGGSGGGVIIITAPSLAINGVLNASGTNGGTSCCGPGSPGGGGGAGGSVLLVTDSLSGSGAITATGGNGAVGDYISNGGGGGGGGRVAVYYNTSTFSPLSSSVTAGKGASTYYAAADGDSGTIMIVDMPNNDVYILDGAEFNGTLAAPYGSFKASTGAPYTFANVKVLRPSLVRYKGATDVTLNATFINLTGSNAKVTQSTRVILQYASTSSTLGRLYNASSAGGTFLLTVDERPTGKVEWSGAIPVINNLDADFALTANNVYANAVADPGLNKSANVSIVTDITGSYNIMFDGNDDGVGELCVDCVKYGITNGVARFSAPHFSSYWLSSAHDFIAPLDNATSEGFVFNSSVDGALVNGSTSDIDQVIDVVDASSGKPKLQLTGAFSRQDVNLSGLVVLTSGSKTVVITENITGVAPTHAIFVPIQSNAGVYVCPNATRLNDVISSCLGYTRWTYNEAVAGTSKQLDNLGYNVTVTIVGSNYKISGLRGTGVAEGGVTTLTVWDETETDGSPFSGLTKYNGNQVRFFANFTNTSGLPANVSNGACKIDYAAPSYDGYDAMAYNSTLKLFVGNRTFSSDGVFSWKVNCSGMSGGTAEGIEASDTVTISLLVVPFTTDVPEFGTWALLIALGLVAGGIVSMRRKK